MEELNKVEKTFVYTDEKRGLYTILVLMVLSWGGIMSPWFPIVLVSWVAMGIELFAMWRIVEGLLDRLK